MKTRSFRLGSVASSHRLPTNVSRMPEETHTPIAPRDALRQLIARLGPPSPEGDRYRWVFPCESEPDGLLIVTAGLTSDATAADVALADACSRNLPAEIKIVIRTWERLGQVLRVIKERTAARSEQMGPPPTRAPPVRPESGSEAIPPR